MKHEIPGVVVMIVSLLLAVVVASIPEEILPPILARLVMVALFIVAWLAKLHATQASALLHMIWSRIFR